MHNITVNLQEIIKEIYSNNNNHNEPINVIAVSKTFNIDTIVPLIEYGHVHFGENKVQEALNKWSSIKTKNKDLKLHMIGKLQSNKVKNAVFLFDYIHSLDSLKIAEKIFTEQKKINKSLKIFIQVNLANENQKSGVDINDLEEFYKKCISRFNLNIIGLMCIPPISGNTNDYFSTLKKLNLKLGLKDLSMGMSSDYIDAVRNGATYLRIGSKIFGNRS